MTRSNETRNVVALRRISTEEQAAEGRAGLLRQQEEIRLACERWGLNVVRDYEIVDVSGSEVHLNSTFLQVLQDLAQPSLSGLVAAALDRVTRPDSFSSFSIWDVFVKNKKMLFLPTAQINPAEDSGFMETIVGSMMASLDRRRILRNTQMGKEANRKRGRCPSAKHTLPQGVDFDFKTGKWSWLEPYASRIREAFRVLIAEQPSIRSLAERLGCPCARTLSNQLRNPIWTGIREYKYRRGEKYPSKNGRQRDRKKVLREEPLRVKIDIEPLIDEKDFNLVQEILARRKNEWTSSREQESVFESTGIIYCGRCGKRMYSRPDRRPGRRDEYYCKSQFPSGRGCGAPRVWRERLDYTISSFVSEYFTKPAQIVSLLASLSSRLGLRPVQARIEKARIEIAKLNEQKSRLLSNWVKGHFTGAEVETVLRRIDSEMQSWTILHRQAEREADTLSLKDIRECGTLIASLFAEFEFLELRDRKRLLRQFLARVYVRDGAIQRLTLRVPSSVTNSGIRMGRGSWPRPA
jgi:DNA invertase Pin-like site-specific DNA recombinase